MKKQIFLLRLSYWSAAIADFSIAILVLIPERMGLTEMLGIEPTHVSMEGENPERPTANGWSTRPKT